MRPPPGYDQATKWKFSSALCLFIITGRKQKNNDAKGKER